MNTIEIARKLAALQQVEDAQRAYTMVLQQADDNMIQEQLEAALYILQTGGDHRITFTTLQKLHTAGHFAEDCFHILTEAFYEPNKKLLKSRYEKNCKQLSKYPYLFRKDFPAFEELPVLFYPFDDNGFVPFDTTTNTFGSYVNVNHTVVSRNFFKDLEKPILADDVFSQYELEYLKDNVRKSEWVGRENHIYLHYTNWLVFCSYLQVLNVRPLLEDKKIVFLMEEEISQYPIDFKERFGIDYSQYPVKPIGIREVNKLIWHTQLSSHNGGDFFNEIFHGHPNLLLFESIMFDSIEEVTACVVDIIKSKTKCITDTSIDPNVRAELSTLKNPNQKDILVALYLGKNTLNKNYDRNSRIVPALFFQPHFHNINYSIVKNIDSNVAMLHSPQYEQIRNSPIFKEFKYIKTFTPMRRITTSYGASIKFGLKSVGKKKVKDGRTVYGVLDDNLSDRILNRSYMIDWQDRLYKDSRLVRFEDGKLNPKATFTALAAFLDIPCTESMTYCSGVTGINPESLPGNDIGFSTAAVYRTYDEYCDGADRMLIEYLFRDAYQQYGYDMMYYHGEPVDEAWIEQKSSNCRKLDNFIYDSYYRASLKSSKDKQSEEDQQNEAINTVLEQSLKNRSEIELKNRQKNRKTVALTLHESKLRFVNKNGQPLRFMQKLELDPALLEQPLYH